MENAVRQEQQAEEVLQLMASAKGHDLVRHVLVPLPTTVPAQVVRRPIGVAVAVGPVPLFVVRDDVVESVKPS